MRRWVVKRKENMDLESSHSNKAMSTINLLGELKLESLLSSVHYKMAGLAGYPKWEGDPKKGRAGRDSWLKSSLS